METELRWQKKWYESQYQLFLENKQIGEISPIAFSSRTVACLGGNKYIFRPSGFMLKKIHIIDAGTQNHLGDICFSRLGTQATINLNAEESYRLKCENVFIARWTISRSQEELINYSGNNNRGNIRTAIPHKLLLITGLYASIFQWRKFAFFVAIFIPLLVIFSRTVHY